MTSDLNDQCLSALTKDENKMSLGLFFEGRTRYHIFKNTHTSKISTNKMSAILSLFDIVHWPMNDLFLADNGYP